MFLFDMNSLLYRVNCKICITFLFHTALYCWISSYNFRISLNYIPYAFIFTPYHVFDTYVMHRKSPKITSAFIKNKRITLKLGRYQLYLMRTKFYPKRLSSCLFVKGWCCVSLFVKETAGVEKISKTPQWSYPPPLHPGANFPSKIRVEMRP